MRTISDDVAVRLYHLDDDGTATTLLYGTLAAACARAGGEDEAVQAQLYLQTANDVVAWVDFADG